MLHAIKFIGYAWAPRGSWAYVVLAISSALPEVQASASINCRITKKNKTVQCPGKQKYGLNNDFFQENA